MSDIFLALDLGSSKIAAIIGNIEKEIEILGYSIVPSQGIQFGNIVDMNSASSCVSEAVERAEKMLGKKVSPRVVVAIGNESTVPIQSKGVVIIKNKNQEITSKDVERVIETAKTTLLPPNKEIIYALKKEFRVDGQNNIENPVGLTGTRLEADVILITHDVSQIRNVINVMQRANLYIEGFIPKEVALSEAILTEDEMNLGVALADIGGDLSHLAVYKEGSLISTGVLRLGGERITKDIAIGLRLKPEEAEKAKILIGSLKDVNKSLEVTTLQGDKVTINSNQLKEIIQPRVEQILYYIDRKFQELSYPLDLLPGGLIITGGTALLDGIEEFASNFLKIPVKRRCPSILTSYMRGNDAYFFTVAMGALLRIKKDMKIYDKKQPWFTSLKEKFMGFFRPFTES
ncbi:MAG: cell division protein FtsA [Dictyoglomus sp. NZ13-RE01]|nr:MAG: cell division protein FtsA [Dictyoglomus sp. NZ13-RE01]